MKKLDQQLEALTAKLSYNPAVAKRYLERLREGRLTRDENPTSHFCVYFAAFDPKIKEVFIGHHKKANLWLFSGGHIDQDELIEEAVSREIWEEWGQRIPTSDIPRPSLLTITDVVTPNVVCKTHFDIWHFFPVEKENFFVDDEKLLDEFHETGWKTFESARRLVMDSSTVVALDKVYNHNMSESNNADYGHALGNLFGPGKLYKEDFGPEKDRVRVFSSILKNLRLFGPQFIDVLKDNPKFPTLGVTEENLQHLLQDVLNEGKTTSNS